MKFLLPILVGLLLSPAAMAQSNTSVCDLMTACGMEASLGNAQTAFIGKVVSSEPPTTDTHGDTYVAYTVEVRKILKGSPESSVRVVVLDACAPRSFGSGTETKLDIGETYGFALRAGAAGTYQLDPLSCGDYGVTTPENLRAAFAGEVEAVTRSILPWAGAGVLVLILSLLLLRLRRSRTVPPPTTT